MGKIIKKTLSIITALLLLFYQNLFPIIALAQETVPEPSPTTVVTAEPVSEPAISESPQPSLEPAPSQSPLPSESPEPTTELNSLPQVDENLTAPVSSESAAIDTNPTESQVSVQLTPSVWKTNEDGSVTTNSNVVLNQTYSAPQNDKVTVTFTKLPESPGTLTIKQIILSQEDKEDLGAFSNTAYEITSTMEDGTFEYTLTLPTSTTENVEVKASEDGQTFVTVEGSTAKGDVLTIIGLTHFTVFVVVGTMAGSSSTPFDESGAQVLINEFVFVGSSDWVELYNRGTETINLSGWKLKDNTSTMVTLSGLLYPNGFLSFNVSNRLNAASSGDVITLENSSGKVIDRVSYKDSTSINGADNVGSVGSGESVGRTSDGIIAGDVWTKYSSPTKGFNNSGEPTFITVDDNEDNYHYNSIRDALGDIVQGGTINVLAGNYEEADIMVETENVTIQGPGIGQGVNRAIVNGSCGDSSPPAMFHLHADGITLKGFEIDGSDCEEHGVHVGGASEEFRVAGITVTQNIIYSSDNGVTISIASSYDRERPNIISENDISQNESAGVYLLSASNNIIRDNKIYENESYGIRLDNEGSGPSNNNQILNNTIKDNDETGIYSGGSPISDLVINGNEITGNYTGIYLEQIEDSLTISGNKVRGHDSYGLYLNTISNARVVIGGIGQGAENTITGNGDDDDGSGIYLGTIQNNSSVSVLNNSVSQNGSSNNDPGIYVGSVSDSQDSLTIRGNTISQNSGQGVYVNSVNQSTLDVSANTITANFYEGLVLFNIDGSRATIAQNTISQNGVDEEYAGLFIRTIRASGGTSTVTVSGNTISENGDQGIDVFRVGNATLTIGPGNIISGNRGTGINLQRRVTGSVITGNTITRNGVESQTTGIVVRNALGNEAHLNNISGNGVGVTNDDEENTFNAIENWWGSSLGPQGQGTDSVSGNILFKPWCLDERCRNIFAQAPQGSLLRDTSFGVPPGSTFENAPSLSFLSDSLFNVAHTGGTSTITVPSGVVITRSDGSNLNVNELAATAVTLNSLTGLGTGVIADGALQWGLPNIELTFTSAITLSIFVGTALDGQTLNVVRSTTGTDGWTSTGIVSPGTCVVANGLCTFQATRASYFATNRSTTSASSTSGSTQATTTPSGPFPAPVCNDAKPGSAPTLLSASGGSNSLTLTWSKAANPLTYYLATYGLAPGSQQYGNPNVGGADSTSYTVSNLSGGTTYYFKVRAGNGCAPGEFSNELSASPGGGFVAGLAAGFAPGVLGASTQTEGNVGIGDEKSPERVGGSTPGIEPGTTLGEQAETKPSGRNWFLITTVLAIGVGASYFIFRRLLKP